MASHSDRISKHVFCLYCPKRGAPFSAGDGAVSRHHRERRAEASVRITHVPSVSSRALVRAVTLPPELSSLGAGLLLLPPFQGLAAQDFPGGPVVKTLHFHCRECRIEPWLGNEDLVGCVAKKRKGFSLHTEYVPCLGP